MKSLTLKIDDKVFDEAEEIIVALNLSRNRYFNEAVKMYNLFNRRQLLKKKLAKESKLTATGSIQILNEFEKFWIEN